jgi:hypothetical protein
MRFLESEQARILLRVASRRRGRELCSGYKKFPFRAVLGHGAQRSAQDWLSREYPASA